MSYCVAVRANHTLITGTGRAVTAAAAARMIPARAWHRMRTGSGTKGTRHYDWAMLEVTSDDSPAGQPDGHSVLLVRRHCYTDQLSYYRCWSPGPVPLSRLIAIAVARWRIEEDHQLSNRPPAWTPDRSSAGSPGTAGPRSACWPTSTLPWPSPCNASTRPTPTWTPVWSRSPFRSCCGCCAASSSHRPGETGPPVALVSLATPPPAPRPPSPPTLERLRQDNTMSIIQNPM